MKTHFIIFFLVWANLPLLSQENGEKLGPKWGIKLGISHIMDRIVDEPISGGRGLACWASSYVDTKASNGARLGLYFQYPFLKNWSVIVGPEFMYQSDTKVYNSYFACVRGTVSQSDGEMTLQKLTGHLSTVIRRDIGIWGLFLETGVYYDMKVGQKSFYQYTKTTYLNPMFQPYPTPIIDEETTQIDGNSYGAIFCIGNNSLLSGQNLELRLQHYLGMSTVVPLEGYRNLRQNMIDFSFNYRF